MTSPKRGARPLILEEDTNELEATSLDLGLLQTEETTQGLDNIHPIVALQNPINSKEENMS